MAAQHALGRSGTRALMMIAVALFGLSVASPTVGAAEPPTSSTSTSSTTSTTSTTVPDPSLTPPQVLAAPEPLAVESDPSTVRAGSTERSGAATANGAELPFTGSGTPLALGSAFGALAIGGLALWWGSRKRPEVGSGGPGPTG